MLKGKKKLMTNKHEILYAFTIAGTCIGNILSRSILVSYYVYDLRLQWNNFIMHLINC